MIYKMIFICVIFLNVINSVFMQGSGDNGNLRICVVEGRGKYKRAAKYCPVLDREHSGIECVLGTDRLDCLRRISKGTVDFGVFSPEDLVAAQWAKVDVLVTNELRSRDRPFERTVMAVVNRLILSEDQDSLHAIMKNRTLCHPEFGIDDIRPMSDTLTGYLESLVIPRSCDPKLSLAENKIKALAEFFGKSCKAGPWVLDNHRDAELKSRYHSLCAACYSAQCDNHDRFWGDVGALACLTEVGDITWSELDDVLTFFGLKPSRENVFPDKNSYAFLCRDGSHQPIDNVTENCVWLHRPWPVIVAKRKASESVTAVLSTLTTSPHPWHGALVALLEARQLPPTALQPSKAPEDYLAHAYGFREAYSQSGCDPPRHITLCTKSNLERNKCEWLSEAGAVYGVTPPLQCITKSSIQESFEAAERGECVVEADTDWLLKGIRDYELAAVIHESTTIVEQTNTVVAYVTEASGITKMADLRGKRAIFPEYDGFAWHSVFRYINKTENVDCKNIKGYFKEICAPGFEKLNVSDETKLFYTKNCYKNDNGSVMDGEIEALRAVVEGKSDVAFISMQTYNLYADKKLSMYSWAEEPIRIIPICPEENDKYCFLSWSSLGHIFASKNLTTTRKQDIINVFTKLDKLFSEHSSVHSTMFSMYGAYNHQMDVIFNSRARSLITDDMFRTHPYYKIPLSFERSLSISTDSCHLMDFVNLSATTKPQISLILFLVLFFLGR